VDLTAQQREYFTSSHALDILSHLDARALPAHVAIIMDGNGRWATAQGKSRLTGHKAGVAAVREAIGTSVELGIDYLTVYSFSSENWSRPLEEVSGIMTLFVEVLSREVKHLNEQNVRVQIIGATADLPEKTKKAFEECVHATSANSGLTMVVALNYGSRQDIAAAARKLAQEARDGALDPASIDPATISAHLSTAGIPDPDLVIRTSGEKRLSNFLLYEAAYAELYVTPTLWPDFDRDAYLDALIDYQKRSRRFGGIA
jgi:undecaprenyl diphosphate synthase